MAHVHSWKQWKDGRYYCVHPTCYLKLNLRLLHGKLAECPKCQREFLINADKEVGPVLTCEFCNSGDESLTLDGQKKLMVKFIQETLDDQVNLIQKQLKVEKAKLDAEWRKITEEKERIERALENLKTRREKFHAWFKEQRANLKPKKELPQIPTLPDSVNIMQLVERELNERT